MTREEENAKSLRYYYANKERLLKNNAEWYRKNKNNPEVKKRLKENKRKWYLKNKTKHKKRGQLWREKNRERDRELRRIQLKKALSNPETRIPLVIRARIKAAILNKTQYGSSMDLLGASVETVRKYIEKQFKSGMTWENHGIYGWHLDHRIPLASFDLTDEVQQKKAFHYRNLQPLWAKENLSKGTKILN